MFYSIIYHRKSKGAVASHFHESTKVEIAWTVVPFFILIGMAVPATSSLLSVYNTDDAELDILVTGFQWKWKYEYIDEKENVSFFSNLRTPQSEILNIEPKGEHYLLEVDEPMVIPVDTKVRFLITANDVIHSWWVPELAVKRDAIPGFINEAWTKVHTVGVYRGQCAELCGKDHGFMPIVVNVVSKDEYATWLSGKQAEAAAVKELMAQTFTLDQLMERGADVYARSCLACHGANGEGSAQLPRLAHQFSGYLHTQLKQFNKRERTNDNAVMHAIASKLTDLELKAVASYLSGLK
jgi:cytochrome c oxidase subunit 2